jgi:MFS family permease
MYASFILLPQYVETPTRAGYGFAASVTQAGLFMAPSTLAMLIFGSQTGRLEKLFGSKPPLLAGGVLTIAAFLLLAFERGSRWEIYLAAALLGAGIGLAFAAMANLIIENVGPEQTGVATGMNTVMRTLGGALGGQLSATFIAAHTIKGLPAETGFSETFVMATGFLIVCLLAGLLVPRRPAVQAGEIAGAREAEHVDSTEPQPARA